MSDREEARVSGGAEKEDRLIELILGQFESRRVAETGWGEISALLREGADPNAMGKADLFKGFSALNLIIGLGNPAAARELIAFGADCNQARPDGQAPLDWAIDQASWADEEHVEVALDLLEALLEGGAAVAGGRGRTSALMSVARGPARRPENTVRLAEALISHGANPEQISRGKPLAEWARGAGNEGLAAFLMAQAERLALGRSAKGKKKAEPAAPRRPRV